MTDNLKKNYSLLSIVQYCASFFVIIVHSGQLIDNEIIHFITKSTFGRLAVPIFIISSAYFYRINITNKKNKKIYFVKMLKQYLFWSVFYVPFGISYLISENYSFDVVPTAILLGLFYIGTYYHLWYYPALIFALLFTDKLTKIFKLKTIFFILILLYSFGSLETYSSYIPPGLLLNIYQTTHDFLFTFRNGLFYSSVFVLIGFVLVKPLKNSFLIKYQKIIIPLAIIIYLIEDYLVFNKPGLDKNFFLALIPLSFYVMYYVLNDDFFKLKKKTNQLLRYLAKMNYLLHPALMHLIIIFFHKNYFDNLGFILFFLTASFATLIGLLLYSFKNLKNY